MNLLQLCVRGEQVGLLLFLPWSLLSGSGDCYPNCRSKTLPKFWMPGWGSTGYTNQRPHMR
jgi:hypothetical protein